MRQAHFQPHARQAELQLEPPQPGRQLPRQEPQQSQRLELQACPHRARRELQLQLGKFPQSALPQEWPQSGRQPALPSELPLESRKVLLFQRILQFRRPKQAQERPQPEQLPSRRLPLVAPARPPRLELPSLRQMKPLFLPKLAPQLHDPQAELSVRLKPE